MAEVQRHDGNGIVLLSMKESGGEMAQVTPKDTNGGVDGANGEVPPSSTSPTWLSRSGSGKRRDRGITLTCHGVGYEVDVKARACAKAVKKQILQNINGIFKPGMNAIMGPTGGGKTTLLDVLAARKEPEGLSGVVLADGGPLPNNFKCMTGYVVQDDIIMGTLTVRENLEFSAALRLPTSISHKEKKERVRQVLVELGLTQCAETKVGTEMIRGVSGGERKRTNIGMELITAPPVLFLDEPTTGLDASTANVVMMLLQRLSQRGKTIIFSIHQPRFSIFRLFDSLMLLANGEVVYHGASGQALDYFQSIGHECELHNNPADFFLDVINGDSTAVAAVMQDIEKEEKMEELSVEVLNENNKKDIANSENDGALLSQQYTKSRYYQETMSQLEPLVEKQDTLGTKYTKQEVSYRTSFLHQCKVVIKRTLKNLVRNPQASVAQVMLNIIFALIIGIIYLQIDDSASTGVQNRTGVFFFLATNMMFGSLSAVDLFARERQIFIHESASGYYRVSTYFFSKIFCDVIPMRLIPVSIFGLIAYWMIGLRPEVGAFFFFLLTLFSTTMAASSIAFAISATTPIFQVAQIFITLAFIFMLLMGGFLVNLGSVGPWINWLKYFSIVRYCINGLTIPEFRDRQFCDAGNITSTAAPVGEPNVVGSVCVSGNTYMTVQEIDYTLFGQWSNMLGLWGIMIICLTLCYIQLRRIKKLK
ncbi:broad substrate specificity ATP-binding cassette transporter ABCG2-like isoform X1 [Branchiostoma floridae]|uniref:Broad substrate specificity ATP-binding cassette transporter ABCG2-like isoform X1 n=1 Tax=Branchiostoma floridae TaxID=7739 RepID=A0A9J7MJ15_BRAFL|nr:broad substrate specificity ATP-binding cassette transporter ABCG2-like isoform X1 [Branchiostoma floridae]